MEDIDICYPDIEKRETQDSEETEDRGLDLSFQHITGEEIIIEAVNKDKMAGEETDAEGQDLRWGAAIAKDVVEPYESDHPKEDMQEDPLPGKSFEK
jgi:hypothetical protein